MTHGAFTVPDPTPDPTPILASLGIHDADAIVPVHGGNDTTIWRVTHGGATSALRLFRAAQRETWQREVEAMEAARAAALPVPTIRASALWQEQPVLLLSWCAGIPLAEAIRQKPWRVWALGHAFGRTQARLHQLPTCDDWQVLREEWIGWAGEDPELWAALERRKRPRPSLLHLDYHPLNVLTDGREITALLDWANARLGDPRADVARTYTILRVEPYQPGPEPRSLSLVRRLVAWSWRRGYEEVAGSLDDMAWFYAWAGALMARDLAPRLERPGSWWRPHHIARIEGWATRWRERASKGR